MKRTRLLYLLEDARKAAEMALASFGNFGDKTEEVKELTRLYRDSWLIAPLDEAIEIVRKG